MQFRGYREIWRKQGCWPCCAVCCTIQIASGVDGARTDGERVLTNLTELLQQASAELDGEQALIRHLSEHLALSGQTGEESNLAP